MKLINTTIINNKSFAFPEASFYFFTEETSDIFEQIFGVKPKRHYDENSYDSSITQTFNIENTKENNEKFIIFIFDDGTYKWLPCVIYDYIKTLIHVYVRNNEEVYYLQGYIFGVSSPYQSQRMMSANNYNGYQFWQKLGIKNKK